MRITFLFREERLSKFVIKDKNSNDNSRIIYFGDLAASFALLGQSHNPLALSYYSDRSLKITAASKMQNVIINPLGHLLTICIPPIPLIFITFELNDFFTPAVVYNQFITGEVFDAFNYKFIIKTIAVRGNYIGNIDAAIFLPHYDCVLY